MCLRKSFLHLGNEDILKDLLEAVLDISIKNVTVKNPELPVNLYDSKAGILDINVEIDDNTICNIEMQVSNLGNFDKRSTYYMSRIFSENLKSSEDYSKLKKAIVINFLDFELYKRNSYHSIAHMKFENTKEIEFVDMGYSNDEQFAVHDLEMHFIEIPKFVKKNPNTDARLEQWLWLLAGREEKLEMAKKKINKFKVQLTLLKE